MKAKELIKVLETLPEDLEVFAWDCQDGFYLVNSAIKCKVVEYEKSNGTTLLSTLDFMSNDDVTEGQEFIGLSNNK